jgi:hypothetical protein
LLDSHLAQPLSVNKESVIAALKTGRGYGMEIGFIKDEVNARRKRIRDALPRNRASCNMTVSS